MKTVGGHLKGRSLLDTIPEDHKGEDGTIYKRPRKAVEKAKTTVEPALPEAASSTIQELKVDDRDEERIRSIAEMLDFSIEPISQVGLS